MIPANKTLAAVDAFCGINEEPFRNHLGSSVIGKECAREIYYGYRWVKAEQFSGRMLRLFNRGHLEEKRFVGYLRGAGVEVWEAGESGDQKSAMRFSDICGHFGGTPDGIGRGLPDLPPDEPFLLEFKTHNDKSFKKLQADGIMATKWQHFVQMQILMHKLEMRYALYCAVNKNDDDILMELVQYEERAALRAIERADSIIWAQEPPPRISKSPAHWGCKYCHLNRLCHFGDEAPLRNCRTCAFGFPNTNGRGGWTCRNPDGPKEGSELMEADQRAGCEAYQVNPVLTGEQP